jgi:hypothetical protein
MRMRGITVDYDALVNPRPSLLYGELVDHLMTALPPLWQKAYRKMAQSPTSIHPFSQHGFEFLFDRASELRAKGVVKGERAVEDRIVVAYGRSLPTSTKSGCDRHLLGSAGAQFGEPSERAYLSGGVLGGVFDISLYPQFRDLDRERSNESREYRDMKNYCCAHVGTFCFTRLIYASRSWKPAIIEHGLLRTDGSFWVRSFQNEAVESRASRLQWTALLGRKASRESSLAD